MTGHYAITIGRQFGSGGRMLGRMLAEKLGIPFYDKELLAQAARESGISQEFFIENDEREPGALRSMAPMSYATAAMPWYTAASSISDESLYGSQSSIIRSVAEQGPCVIVGRTADYVLRDHPCLVNIFLCAELDDCCQRMIERGDSANMEQARAKARRINKLRANYYNFYTDKTWGAAESYDLCFNTSRLSLEQIADVVVAYLNARLQTNIK